MKRRKLTSKDIDKVRDVEGFPIATDEAIIELSDAPYYTACPNPFIKDFIDEYGTPYNEATDDYHCEPFRGKTIRYIWLIAITPKSHIGQLCDISSTTLSLGMWFSMASVELE